MQSGTSRSGPYARRTNGWAAVWVCAALLACAAPAAGQVVLRSTGGRTSSDRKPIPLANYDDEHRSHLAKAKALIEDKSYELAITILQAMLEKTDASGVIPESNTPGQGSRYVSIRVKVNELIGSMGPEGLKIYREKYDPQAEQYYRQGLDQLDPRPLRKVVNLLVHTSFGRPALEALGQLYFDGGQFMRAYRAWSRLEEIGVDDKARPLLLARLAAAAHLAGQPARALKALGDLQKAFPDAQGPLGGQQRDLSAFVQAVLKLPVDRSARVGELGGNWPGLGGIPDGMGVMQNSDVVLAARWRHPDAGEDETDINDRLVIEQGSIYPTDRRQNVRIQSTLRNGAVHVMVVANNNATQASSQIPAFVQPVVAGEVVYYRSAEAVIGCDLITGKTVCRSMTLPIFRDMRANTRNVYYGFYGFGQVADHGQYTLTAAGDKIFAVANYRPPMIIQQRMGVGNPQASDASLQDNSQLVALSVSGQLRMLWHTGYGKGEDDVVRNAKFLSAPTCSDGRLYVVGTFGENYYLFCFDADTGARLWQQLISEAPAIPQNYGYQYNLQLDKGSPPAVSEGRVFALTNAGVVAAFDADTGQIAWAYQYPSEFDAFSGGARVYRPRNNRLEMGFPPNPMIVTGGKVVLLPADGRDLLILSAEDGRPLAEAVDRENLRDLSAMDADRVCLSGGGPNPAIKILSIENGQTLWQPAQTLSINGRPAVTDSAILASGDGELIRVDYAKGYHLSRTGLAGGGPVAGLLGNLISVREELIAANAAGLSAYMSYEQARAKLTERMATANPRERALLMLRRGQFAFNGQRFKVAMEDLLAAGEGADEATAAALDAAGLRSWQYRTFVALGNEAHGDPAKMFEYFQRAESYASTDQERAHMALRLAKYHRQRAEALAAQADRMLKSDRLAESAETSRQALEQATLAAETAQRLGADYHDEHLVDVIIGANADNSVRFAADEPRTRASILSQRLVAEVLKQFGRRPYGLLDLQAKQAFEQGRTLADPKALEAVAVQWPNSVWADDARLAAGELLYLHARDANGRQSEDLLTAAAQDLDPLTKSSDDPNVQLAARVGLATIYHEAGWSIVAADHCEQARLLAADSKGIFHDVTIAFADRRGKLSELLARIEGEKTVGIVHRIVQFSRLQTPAHEVYHLGDVPVCIMRDQNFEPLRLGQKVVILRDRPGANSDLLMLDTGDSDPKRAVQAWGAIAPVRLTGMQPQQVPSMRTVAGFSADHKVLAVADAENLRGFSVESGKAVWNERLSNLGLSGPMYLAVGDGVLVAQRQSGEAICVDLATGKRLWLATPGRGRRGVNTYPSGPAVIGRGLVVLGCNNGRSLEVYDARTGKLQIEAGRLNGRLQAQAMFNETGLLIVLVDGKLQVFDKDLSKPVWTKPYQENRYPAILAVSRDRLAVSPTNTDDTVEILSATTGKQLGNEVKLSSKGVPSLPVDAAFDGDDLFVVTSLQNVGRRKYQWGQFSMCRGMSVSRVSLGVQNEIQWQQTISGDMNTNCFTLPLVIGRDTVVATYKPYNPDPLQSAAVLLNRDTGSKLQSIPLVGKKEDPSQVRNSLYPLGPPVMTNGRLCVETTEGITVYGE